jgi:glutaredoxin
MKLFSRVILPLLLLVYIAIETYAKLNHTSICGSEGCKLAGQLLLFPSIYLNYMGLAAAFGILVLGWLSLKNEAFERLFFIALYAAIGFETIMFAYQFFVNPEPCTFCAGVYGSLIAIALFSRPRYLLYALPMIAGLWVALGSLAIPKNASLITTDGYYLIHSKTCSHCKKVKTYFAEHSITYNAISVHHTNAQSLLTTLNIDAIPVLLIRKSGKITVLKGDKPIIGHFASPVDSKTQTPQKGAPSAAESTEVPLQDEEKEGCSLDNQFDASPGEESGCEQDAAVPLR